MNASANAQCPSCQGPLGPWSVTVQVNGVPVTACSDKCAGRVGSGPSAEDYRTIPLEVDVLRKALLRRRAS